MTIRAMVINEMSFDGKISRISIYNHLNKFCFRIAILSSMVMAFTLCVRLEHDNRNNVARCWTSTNYTNFHLAVHFVLQVRVLVTLFEAYVVLALCQTKLLLFILKSCFD
jgi:hypothetical protein